MKFLLLIVLSLFIHTLPAQNSLPVINAGSKKAFIREGNEERTGWTLNPKIKLDIHIISKSVQPKQVTFYTDIDSIKVIIKPGSHADFIVVLNGKDSFLTRMEAAPIKNYAAQQPALHDTIPFELTEFNNIKIKAVLNHTDTLNLKFDSGTTGLLLTNDAIKTKTHLSNTDAADNTLQFGHLTWDSLQIYPVTLSGQGTDGRFGWDLFDGKIVEIDYDKNIFIVHTQLPAVNKAYEKFDIQYTHTLFCIQGTLQVRNKRYHNRFLFDNGYQRTIMLDTVLMQEQHYPKDLPVIKKVIMKNGQGKEIPVITVNNEQLNLGKLSLFNIPVQLMATGNPAGFKTHILGNEVLKRFNTLIDFQKNILYLKPNSLANLPYADAR